MQFLKSENFKSWKYLWWWKWIWNAKIVHQLSIINTFSALFSWMIKNNNLSNITLFDKLIFSVYYSWCNHQMRFTMVHSNTKDMHNYLCVSYVQPIPLPLKSPVAIVSNIVDAWYISSFLVAMKISHHLFVVNGSQLAKTKRRFSGKLNTFLPQNQ